MITKLNDPSIAAGLFAGWNETLIWSCLDSTMGSIYVTDEDQPDSACASVGCFDFYAGVPDAELLDIRRIEFRILVPQSDHWNKLIEAKYPRAKKVTRYALRKDTVFDQRKLKSFADSLPEGYLLRRIDRELYDRCLNSPMTIDFVSTFADQEAFLHDGIGFVIMKDGRIVSGASSYSRYSGGIEIEVDTDPAERRRHLATAVSAALILECIRIGLYPSWDAQNLHSLQLAINLGCEFDHEYIAYELTDPDWICTKE